MPTHIFSVLCENEPGMMMRICRSFMRRQVNIDSITVGIEPSGLARIILMFNSDERTAEFLRQVLLRLTQVIDVEKLEEKTSIVREIALLKTKQLSEEERGRVLEEIEKVGGRVLQVAGKALIAEIYGDHERIEKLIHTLGSGVLKEVARSGQVIISKTME
ncbi:MAG: acetolactate synthase small subunit [Hadesarchaea archaeon]|nr:acetolactate synthase small subunit [Hadesarchaea archaeon]